ncbi:MAG: 4-hydroxy-tetrahydrodipicolinate reductase [Oscillospiraceae bacterium]|nr:4-hydroxy-tetrahydrodipicolinate reductase [Oscillospiraceae bacterium]
MKILVSGLGGHMGREVARLAQSGCRGARLAAGVDVNGCEDFGVPCARSFSEAPADVDCIVDFSNHKATAELLDFALAHRLPLVLATTGQTEEERAAIVKAAEQIPVFFAANYSLGVALLLELAKRAAAVMSDAEIEIVEIHHDRKLDAPSGTALALAEAIQEVRPDSTLSMGRSGHAKRTKQEIGIQSVRMGNIVGIHEVMVGTANETVTLRHEAYSRALFAEGALAAAQFLMGKGPGLYNMQSMLSL